MLPALCQPTSVRCETHCSRDAVGAYVRGSPRWGGPCAIIRLFAWLCLQDHQVLLGFG